MSKVKKVLSDVNVVRISAIIMLKMFSDALSKQMDAKNTDNKG